MNILKEIFTNKNFGFFGGGLLPNTDKIIQSRGGYTQLRQLTNDPHLASCIQSRKSGLLSMDWNIIPNGQSETVCKTIESIIKNLDIHQLIRNILESVFFGYQPLEIIWENSANMIVPKLIKPLPQEWFRFDFSGEFRFTSAGGLENTAIPENKLLLPIYEPSSTNPYGTALLSRCYWPVTFKQAGLRFWVNFMERFGMPLLLGQYTRGVSQEEAKNLAEELSNMTEDSVIVTPSDIHIEMKEPMRYSSVDLYKDLIRLCNDEISKSILSETLTTEIQSGSYAASQVHYKVRREVVLADKLLVESVINELIKSIIKLNFKQTVYPRFEIVLMNLDNNELIKRDEILARECGVRFSKQYLMRRYGFEENEIECT
jgi:phage gp29-like protein